MASIAGTDMTSNAEAPPVVGSARGSRGTLIALSAVALILAVVPYVIDERFGYHIAIMVCFAAIGASSLHLIIRTGHVSLCHSAFVGVGAYASANAVMKLNLPFVVGLLAGTLASASLALVIGPIILRLTGKYFVLITFLLSVFLSLARRRQELAMLGDAAAVHRSVLAEYSLPLLDQLISSTTAATLVAYMIYSVSPDVTEKLGTHSFHLTVPIVVFGMFRYVYLIHRRGEGDDPARLLVTDRPLRFSVLAWIVADVLLLYA